MRYAVIELGVSVVLACEAFKISRCMYYYQPKLVDDTVIIDELSALAEKHPKYGFRKLFMRLRNQGFSWNHKRVYRIYCGLKLNLRRKGKKRLPNRHPEPLAVPSSSPGEGRGSEGAIVHLSCSQHVVPPLSSGPESL